MYVYYACPSLGIQATVYYAQPSPTSRAFSSDECVHKAKTTDRARCRRMQASVQWKKLSHASTFPVFCLAIITWLFTSSCFQLLDRTPATPNEKTNISKELQTGWWCSFALAACAFLTDGTMSLSVVAFAPLPIMFWDVLMFVPSFVMPMFVAVCCRVCKAPVVHTTNVNG